MQDAAPPNVDVYFPQTMQSINTSANPKTNSFLAFSSSSASSLKNVKL